MVIPFGFLSPQTIIIVVIVALLVFGPHKMPELMRQLGMAMREFKKLTGDVQNVFSLDDHLPYDRYEAPPYTYTPPTVPYEPLDQYGIEETQPPVAIEALPVVESAAPARKRAPRKKSTPTEAISVDGAAESSTIETGTKTVRKRAPRKPRAEEGTAPAVHDVLIPGKPRKP